jgi:N utilization substance protein B
VETRARARALQALYAWDVRTAPRVRSAAAADTGNPRLPQIADQVWSDLVVAPEERRLAARLIGTVTEQLPKLDQELELVATNWRLARMAVVDRCVLRLAAAELQQGVTPPRVVIKEAVRLAERYGTSQSAQFVNGVLDALARRMDRL